MALGGQYFEISDAAPSKHVFVIDHYNNGSVGKVISLGIPSEFSKSDPQPEN